MASGKLRCFRKLHLFVQHMYVSSVIFPRFEIFTTMDWIPHTLIYYIHIYKHMHPMKASSIRVRVQGSVESLFCEMRPSLMKLTHLCLLSADQLIVRESERKEKSWWPVGSSFSSPPHLYPALGHIAQSCSPKPHSTRCSHCHIKTLTQAVFRVYISLCSFSSRTSLWLPSNEM